MQYIYILDFVYYIRNCYLFSKSLNLIKWYLLLLLLLDVKQQRTKQSQQFTYRNRKDVYRATTAVSLFTVSQGGGGGGSIIITFFTHMINDCSPHNKDFNELTSVKHHRGGAIG